MPQRKPFPSSIFSGVTFPAKRICPVCKSEITQRSVRFQKMETCEACHIPRFAEFVRQLCPHDPVIVRATAQATELADLPDLCRLAIYRLEHVPNMPFATIATLQRYRSRLSAHL